MASSINFADDFVLFFLEQQKLGIERVVKFDAGCLLQGLTEEEAQNRFWINDKDGLITTKRDPAATMAVVKPFARKADEDIEGEGLVDLVKRVRHACYCWKAL